jgi:poly [ADP-ribose] polymerase
MGHIIEPAKSGRAKCRSCKKTIEKDSLRLGEEIIDQFGSGGTTHVWHHVECAAEKKPDQLRAAMAEYDGEIPDRAKLEKKLSESAKKLPPGMFPYAEKAPTGRSKCMACEESIDKDTLRVAIEREVDTGTFKTKGAGYLHPMCAADFTGDKGMFAKVKANSRDLSKDQLAELEAALGAGDGEDEGGGDEEGGDDE